MGPKSLVEPGADYKLSAPGRTKKLKNSAVTKETPVTSRNQAENM